MVLSGVNWHSLRDFESFADGHMELETIIFNYNLLDLLCGKSRPISVTINIQTFVSCDRHHQAAIYQRLETLDL